MEIKRTKLIQQKTALGKRTLMCGAPGRIPVEETGQKFPLLNVTLGQLGSTLKPKLSEPHHNYLM